MEARPEFRTTGGSASCAMQTMDIQERLLLKATVPATQP
jgi:hypothetical protein